MTISSTSKTLALLGVLSASSLSSVMAQEYDANAAWDQSFQKSQAAQAAKDARYTGEMRKVMQGFGYAESIVNASGNVMNAGVNQTAQAAVTTGRAVSAIGDSIGSAAVDVGEKAGIAYGNVAGNYVKQVGGAAVSVVKGAVT